MDNRLQKAWIKISDKLGDWYDTLITNIPNILVAIAVFAIAYFASKYISRFVLKLLKNTDLNKSMRNLISKLVSVAVIFIGLFLVLGILNLGKVLNTILAGAGVAGLAVALALQGALANTYSGIVLSFVKAIKFGDWVETNGYSGEIIELDFRTVTLKEIDNNLVYLPNKMVLENPIKNYSSTNQSRVILNCGVGYSSDLDRVEELVKEIILENFEAVDEKSDIIFAYEEFGDSSITFEVRFWINSTSGLEVILAKSKAMKLIKKAFDNSNIEIPFPIRTLNIPNKISFENASNKENSSTETE